MVLIKIGGTDVLREEFPNTNWRDYHVRQELTDERLEYERGCPRREANTVLRALIRIRGVVRVILKPYRATIVKSPAYTWAEIELQVLRVLEGAGYEYRGNKFPTIPVYDSY